MYICIYIYQSPEKVSISVCWLGVRLETESKIQTTNLRAKTTQIYKYMVIRRH